MVGILIYRAKQADENLIELKTTRFDSLLDSTTDTEDWFDNSTISDYPTASTSAANIIYVSQGPLKKWTEHSTVLRFQQFQYS